ncbi:CAP domain-containing protein [Coprinopsis sp. MPI-PUGE-AT-0042]|nr:CAP domain-containing protein [Coprinopsis sp. MPI-PUGE-AT-0042]
MAAPRHHSRRLAMTRRALELNESDKGTFLQSHNDLRAIHNAGPLTWSSTLAAKAGNWADRCIVAHSQGALMDVRYGETVVASTGNFSIQSAMAAMTRTREQYDPATSYSEYTQLVWKNTREVGCAISRCESILARPVTLYVCLYDPAGNVVGELGQNVEA